MTVREQGIFMALDTLLANFEHVDISIAPKQQLYHFEVPTLRCRVRRRPAVDQETCNRDVDMSALQQI